MMIRVVARSGCSLLGRSLATLTPLTDGYPGVPVLPHTLKPYNSVEIDVSDFTGDYELNDTSDFGMSLVSSLKAFNSAGKLATWLVVPLDFAHYISVAALSGFRFHHAEGDTATMVLWMRPNEPSRIPPFATHQVGVGGLVVRGGPDDNPEDPHVLVIREAGRNYTNFKLPGGLCDVAEDFGDAAVREVREETGVEAEFSRILTMRHQHGMQFGRSDIYCIALLRATSVDVAIDTNELEDARWMKLSEFRENSPHEMVEHAIQAATGEGGAVGLQEKELKSVVPGRVPYKLYYATSGAIAK